MSHFAGFSFPCQHGVDHPFHYTKCYHNKGADERDTRCAICYEDFLDDDCTTVHNVCFTTFHTSCLDLYAVDKSLLGITTYDGFTVDTTRRDQYVSRKNIVERRESDPILRLEDQLMIYRATRDGIAFRCPVCRVKCQAIINPNQVEVPEYISPFKLGDEINANEFFTKIRNELMGFTSVPRHLVLREAKIWQLDPKFRQFYNRHILPQADDGKRPTFDIPEFDPYDRRCPSCAQYVCTCGVSSFEGALRDPAHFDIFLGSRTTQAGVFTLMDETGKLRILLLTPQQNYVVLTMLSRIGFTTSFAWLGRLRCLTDLRGSSLEDIILAAYQRGARHIYSFQLQILFPEFECFKNGMLMHIAIRHMTGQRLYVDIAVGKWDQHWSGPNIFAATTNAETLSVLAALGGLGEKVVGGAPSVPLMNLLDRSYKECALVNRPFGDLSLVTYEVTNDQVPLQ